MILFILGALLLAATTGTQTVNPQATTVELVEQGHKERR